jgi:peptidoglycan hydrolase-like protein with peptidoglycan-binding domain
MSWKPMSWKRVVATAVTTSALAVTAAYGIGTALHNGASASPELAPRVAQPSRAQHGGPSVVSTPQATPTKTPGDQAVPPATEPAEPSPTSEPTTTPAPPAVVLAPGDRGVPVRELQSRLFQLAWLPELTTGRYDPTTKEAVQGFQVKRGLPGTGTVDRPTWRRLKAMTETPTHDAMFNVLRPGPAILEAGAEGDDVRAAQARLKQIAWIFGDVTGSYDDATVEAVRGFQDKRGIPVTGEVDQRTLALLQGMTGTPSHDELFNIEPSPGELDARCRTGRVLCIDKTSRTVRWVVDGHVRLSLDARFGSTLNDTPTREGLFHVYLMDADHVSKLFGSSMPYSMFFSGGQALHYSSDFATVGYYGASHGCVNIRDYDGLQWLFSQVRVGDAVVVYWS